MESISLDRSRDSCLSTEVLAVAWAFLERWEQDNLFLSVALVACSLLEINSVRDRDSGVETERRGGKKSRLERTNSDKFVGFPFFSPLRSLGAVIALCNERLSLIRAIENNNELAIDWRLKDTYVLVRFKVAEGKFGLNSLIFCSLHSTINLASN